jgi:hypothetical protein
MTNYIRFFHIETYRFSFATIEMAVTVATLLLFVLLPARHLAFFPYAGFRRFAQRRPRLLRVIRDQSSRGEIVRDRSKDIV